MSGAPEATPARPGRLVVLSAPSGGGKTTIARATLRACPSLRFSVSATTRQPREGELDGRDYHFLDPDTFEQTVQDGGFVEHEQIYGNRYGTMYRALDDAMAGGHDVLLDLDVKGGLSIKRVYGDRSMIVFIRPPSIEVLEMRLRARQTSEGSEDGFSLERRLARVPSELEMGAKFDRIVTNDSLERACREVAELVADFLASDPPDPRAGAFHLDY